MFIFIPGLLQPFAAILKKTIFNFASWAFFIVYFSEKCSFVPMIPDAEKMLRCRDQRWISAGGFNLYKLLKPKSQV